MGGHNLKLFFITEKQSWCAPIMCHHNGTKITEDRKTGMCILFIKQVLLETCPQETQRKLLIYSNNLPLVPMTKHVLRASSVA